MDTSIKSTEKIRTRQDFVTFLNELLADFQTNKNDWENKDLESFLQALARYGEDLEGFYMNTKQDVDADKASWKVFADMFMGARIYE